MMKKHRIGTYELCVVDDVQDNYEYGKMYLVGQNGVYWLCVFHCPCGCGTLLELLLVAEAKPHWTVRPVDEGFVDLSPSIWRIRGCGSHFFIKNNQVIWVSGRPPKSSRRKSNIKTYLKDGKM